jgi:hypothetical protein
LWRIRGVRPYYYEQKFAVQMALEIREHTGTWQTMLSRKFLAKSGVVSGNLWSWMFSLFTRFDVCQQYLSAVQWESDVGRGENVILGRQVGEYCTTFGAISQIISLGFQERVYYEKIETTWVRDDPI